MTEIVMLFFGVIAAMCSVFGVVAIVDTLLRRRRRRSGGQC
jgi:hypothetical protein